MAPTAASQVLGDDGRPVCYTPDDFDEIFTTTDEHEAGHHVKIGWLLLDEVVGTGITGPVAIEFVQRVVPSDWRAAGGFVGMRTVPVERGPDDETTYVLGYLKPGRTRTAELVETTTQAALACTGYDSATGPVNCTVARCLPSDLGCAGAGASMRGDLAAVDRGTTRCRSSPSPTPCRRRRSLVTRKILTPSASACRHRASPCRVMLGVAGGRRRRAAGREPAAQAIRTHA